MSIEDFSNGTNIVIYSGKPTESIAIENVIYQGPLKYIPTGNLSGYYNIRLQTGNKVIQTKGRYVNEIFTIPIVVKP